MRKSSSSRRTAVHLYRIGAGFLLAGLVGHQYRIRVGEVLDEELAYTCWACWWSHTAWLSSRCILSGVITGVFGQGPPVLAGQVRGEAVDVLTGLGCHLAAGEASSEALQQVSPPFAGPLRGLYQMADGRLVLSWIHMV